MKSGVQIHIIGAGGIGSNLIALLLPSLRNGIVSEQLGGITFHLHDADIVEEKNSSSTIFRCEYWSSQSRCFSSTI